MNLGKTIKELSNRLDVVVYPYSSSTNNDIRNNGINYWKGKKIIYTNDWNELYAKNTKYIDNYKSILISRKPLQYFPDDYNGSISTLRVINDELKEAAQKWNQDYYELLEYRKNPTWGRKKCSKCLLSGSLDDPIFIGIEKVFARIVMKHCNNYAIDSNTSCSPITYHCNVMNIFSCPFKSIESYKNIDEKEETSKLPYKKEDLFVLHRISFAIEQALSTFFEITKNNEIIFEVDFENDRVHEIHTNYYGEPESWGWQENVKEQLSKVKPISNIVIRDEQDIYNILTNREKLELLLEEYENNYQLDREEQICCDENTPCVNSENDDSNNKKIISSITTTTTESLVSAERKKQQQLQNEQELNKDGYSHKGENCHSKYPEKDEELDIEYLKLELKAKIKEELEKSHREQLLLLKENKQKIIDFLLGNKDSIRIEDLKIYEPSYKCYREKGNCIICNALTNIVCIHCNDYNKKIWICTNHWQEHAKEKHKIYS